MVSVRGYLTFLTSGTARVLPCPTAMTERSSHRGLGKPRDDLFFYYPNRLLKFTTAGASLGRFSVDYGRITCL
ncbi:hypothetical protein B0H16DRAFT_1583806 [Mycena metata]|uniref:Uncharacterized protein n=1 Tax=Mycena metata TaxID=1033252 RepID=A0AAD7MTK8_9AGAR|nr:hypothetical protein B0H16DRAFT_1583806 [Mycena metata]